MIQDAGWARGQHGWTFVSGWFRRVEQEGLSRRQAAYRFGIGIKSATDWVRRFREDGQPVGQADGWLPAEEVGQHRNWLLERCRAQAFTLRGLVGELAERGLQVEYRTVWDFVDSKRLTYKKH